MFNINIINKMNYHELIQASFIIDNYVHGENISNELNSKNIKVFINEIIKSNDNSEIEKLKDKLSSKIVIENRKSVLDVEKALKEYQELMN